MLAQPHLGRQLAARPALLQEDLLAARSDRDDGYYEHLAQFYNDVYGDTATGDSFNVNQAVVSSLTASKTCM